MRRVSFSVENNQLLLRQNPILMEMDKDEEESPLKLAENVKSFEIEALDPQSGAWTDKWLLTNSLPKMISVTIVFEEPKNSGRSSKTVEGFQRVVTLPSIAVAATWEKPSLRQGSGAGSGGPTLRPQ